MQSNSTTLSGAEVWVTYVKRHPEFKKDAPYTYVLRDPLNNMEPIYVGKGKHKRAFEHHRRTDNHPLVRRLHWMLRRGVNADIQIIPALADWHALFMEECLIKMYGRADLKKGTLLNLTDGGEGVVNPTAEQRAAIGKRASKLMKNVPKTQAQRAKMKASALAIHSERRQNELPLFQKAFEDPVVHTSSTAHWKRCGKINVLATSAKHGVNFKRFNNWVKNDCSF